jgi:hypothetical protein
MKAVLIRIGLGLVLFGAGVMCWAESARARRLAGAYERLATLRFDLDAGAGEATMLADRLPGREDEARRHRATVQYWLSRYDDLAAPSRTTSTETESDPELLFVAANAAFRANQLEVRSRTAETSKTDRGAASPPRQGPRGPVTVRPDLVKRLDGVLQAYASVMKGTARHPDAAYNYEYVVRVRDALAGGRPAPVDAGTAAAAGRAIDLPAGPTLHGRPGAPPPAARVDEFEILAPMLPDERESTQPKANPGGERPDRRG